MKYLINIVLIVIISLLTNKLTQKESSTKENKRDDSTYQRVINTSTIRCGYGLWPSYIDKDPNTGQLSGIFYDFTNELAKSMEMKVEWTEEIPWGDIATALDSDRIDAFCAGAWTNSIRGKYVDFTTPISYSTVFPYVRIDETRFDNNLEMLNSPETVITVIEGESSQVIANTDFPKAKLLVMPKTSEGAQNILNVVSKKADIILGDPTLIESYMKNNPNQIKKLNVPYPTRIFGNTIVIKKGEDKLKEMLNNATNQLIWVGATEKILKKFEKFTGELTRPVLPFKN